MIDFNQKTIEVVEVGEDGTYFDLASITKPLTNSLSYFLSPTFFSPELLLCLNHRAGIPSWGLLPVPGWKAQVLSYPIKESETLYSDISALRVLLELEKKGIKEKQLCESIWDKEMIYWLDLPSGAKTLQTGIVNGEPNFGQVHDPNARAIREFCSHAGIFATIQGTCRTFLNFEEKTGFISKVRSDLTLHSHRFSFGWDRVSDPNNTLAGKGCGPYTFGHLGFTGTSFWVDPDKRVGQVLLTNATKKHWFDKNVLNDMRRAIGETIWKR